ncbi:MAG: DUF2891 domain-containing protein [Opitutaceae bacterium]|nr:DUF2891 domain-containing protein [Opitutaceae bacterium]
MSGPFPTLLASQASEYARLGLANIRREYPHLLQHALNSAADARTPRELHPAFYGSYDWHSCVHQHWMLVRLVLMFPQLPERAEIDRVLHEHLTAANMQAEVDYFRTPGREFFERPYGWAWLLKLAQEIQAYDAALEANMAPLVSYIRAGFMRYLRALTHPVRNGVHGNTAVAVALALGHARAHDDQELKLFCTARAAYWFGHDTDYPAQYEPSGEDFYSPCLVEAGLMARILPREQFLRWFDRFLPRLADGEPGNLLRPAPVSDPTDPKIAHLIGLNLNKGWVWRRLAGIFAADDPRRARATAAAVAHYAAALPLLDAQDFNRAHWLPSFAVYTLTE